MTPRWWSCMFPHGVSLREACDRVKKDRVLEVISIGRQSLPGHGHRKTPHRCGGPQSPLWRGRSLWTGGIDEIAPAIEAARSPRGSTPRDLSRRTRSSRSALGGWYDIVVAMYHDQDIFR